MPKIPVLLIGCGRMGHGIARMLLQEQRRQNLSVSLWIYDPYQQAETRCQEDTQYLQLGAIHSLREYIPDEDQILLQKIIFQIEDNQKALQQTYKILLNALKQLSPVLLLNAATFHAQQLYITLARAVQCDYIDLGQQLPSISHLKQTDEEIKKNQEGVRIVQESGLAPGFANILAVSMYKNALVESDLETVFSVQMRVGGLPQHTSKGGPLHYGPTFSPEGLLYEYEGQAIGLVNGKLVTTSTFTDPQYWEESEISPIHLGVKPFIVKSASLVRILETRIHPKHRNISEEGFFLQGLQARPTADGTSRMCFNPKFQKGVQNLEYKTLRFSPHYQTWNSLKAEGLLEPMLKVWNDKINDASLSGYPDMVLLRVWAQATQTSDPHLVELIVLHDEIPVGSIEGFTAMQHLTGWPTVLLAFTLLHNPSKTSTTSNTKMLQASGSTTGFDRSIKNVLFEGGVIAPYELLDGAALLKQLTSQNRIPFHQLIKYPNGPK
ncbi:MAG: saccharopine dehydrogenase family protein [Candidatus Hodarchaeota archaeon]